MGERAWWRGRGRASLTAAAAGWGLTTNMRRPLEQQSLLWPRSSGLLRAGDASGQMAGETVVMDEIAEEGRQPSTEPWGFQH